MRARRDGEVDPVLVLGAGLAGLSAALAAAGEGRRVRVVSPVALNAGCASAWAQGGMAAALGADDTPELHAADTVAAGAGLVDPETAALLTREGPEAVRRLAALGAPFDRTASGTFAQSLEAAHSRARVARVKGDQAGREIMRAVTAAVLAEPRIEVWTEARARALLQDATGRVRGALIERAGALAEVLSPAVVLATGGLGGLYAGTTTPAQVRGEGLGLAALAGAVIADPEFVQFHPTAIDIGRDPAPLATEALRGEGARLVDGEGRAFMAAYHPDAELAPRDVVARAIHAEREAGRGAYLDATTAVGAKFPHEFPGVFAACMAGGLDPRVRPIPVAPAVHYHMGGVATDAEGRTSLEGLFAAGEVASTGVHGANRLASNSLLEAAVFGARAGRAAAAEPGSSGPILPAEPWPDLPAPELEALRRAMSRHAGVVRDGEGLCALLGEIDALEAGFGRGPVLAAARLVAACALDRRESRGAHFRRDHPEARAPGAPSRPSPPWPTLRPSRLRLSRRLILPTLPDVLIEPVVRGALAEDLGRAGDLTAALIDPAARLEAVFSARKAGRVAGLACARLAVHALDPDGVFAVEVPDGAEVRAGQAIARVQCNARALLSAERTALNLLGRLCGIATLTAAYVEAVAGTRALIVDTRKTTPGLRALEKYAVRCGGGVNHRFGLDDAILIKDNHVAACGGVGEALKRARAAAGHITPIEVEVDSLDQLDEALPHRPDVIMLDNFSLDDLRTAVARAAGAVRLEASGGVTLQTVRAIAETGVDAISVGALTHSAPALDIGLDAV